MATTDPFEEHLARWRRYTREPWARLRYALVGAMLARHLAVQGPGLRVLDVGGGDALDSLPLAEAGHEVTVVDTAPAMLAEARTRAAAAGVADRLRTVRGSLEDLEALVPGKVDVVLCHFVLHYRPAGEQRADLRRLARRVQPDGLLSLVAPNPDGRVLGEVARHGPGRGLAALAEANAGRWASETFAHEGRPTPVDRVVEDLDALGLQPIGRYGGRIANDVLTDDELKRDPAYFQELLDLELALCDRAPFRDVGVYWHLVARR